MRAGVRSRRSVMSILGGASLVLLMSSALLLGSSDGKPTQRTMVVASATATTASTATSTATVVYRPPTVVQATPTARPAPPTATPSYNPPPGPSPQGGVPQIYGSLILVNLSQQWLWVYQDRRLVYDTPVTTGMPQLATPTGIFSIRYRVANVTFYSPWPPGSPYYYSPEHVNYAMYFADDGYYIHDAPWRQVFGPGTNYPHTDPDGVQTTGSHGCVEVPTSAGAWIYNWTPNGATVDIEGSAPIGPTPTPTATTAPPTATPVTPTPTPTSPPPTATLPPPTPTPTP